MRASVHEVILQTYETCYNFQPSLSTLSSETLRHAQLHAFESSDLFRDMAYLDVEAYRSKIAERSKRRHEVRAAAAIAAAQEQTLADLKLSDSIPTVG